MMIEQILDRLDRVRKSRDGWIARCPAHKDRSPSLSIREGDDGRILLHCFAGCAVESICEALGIKLSDLFTSHSAVQSKPSIVREAEKHISHLRSRLTARERDLPVTLVYVQRDNVDAGLAHALALAVQGEIVQCAFEDEP